MTVATKHIFSLEAVRTTMARPSRSFTVYFIRHGEAVHNAEEKLAKRKVIQACGEKGLDPDHKETKRLAEEARKKVLLDAAFFDASITDLGKEEARGARKKMKDCVADGLPAPREVIASPLQRCLSTVEEIFPVSEHAVKVRVEENLRERLTGRPADNRMDSECSEELFPRFDFSKLRSLSSSNIMSLAETEKSDCSSIGIGDDDSSLSSRNASFDDSSLHPTVPPSPRVLRPRGSSIISSNSIISSSSIFSSSCMNTNFETEDDNALRKRAFGFFKILEESESDSVAVVTHKGFLRALERGCFGIVGSHEFKNCELRVYKIQMTPGNLFMDSIERLR